MSIIDSIQLSGSSYDVRDKSATTVVSLTQQEYDALPSSAKTANILYNITDATAGDLTQYWTSAQTQSAITEATSGKVDSSSVVTAVTSASTDSEIPTAKAVYDAIPTGGTGGGKAIVGGRGISVVTGETADTVSFDLPISATTGENLIIGDTSNKVNDPYNSGKSIVFGRYSKVKSYDSLVGGYQCSNEKGQSQVFGNYSKTKNQYEFGCGRYNNSVTASTTFGDSGNTLFSVGNGTAENARHNAFEIRQNGDIYLSSGGTDIKLQDHLGGGGITSGEVQTMIDESISGKADTSSLATVATSGSYNDLDNKPTIPTVPTSNTAFTNDAGYITSSALNGYATTGDVQTMIDKSISGKANSSDVYLKSETSGATEIATALNAKQDTLVSGTSIKTINNESILGSGNITIQGGGGEVSSAITSGDTNAVAGGAVFDAVVYSGNTYTTELTFDTNGYAENWIEGQSAITIDVSGYTSTTIANYQFENSNGEILGQASIYKYISTWWSSWTNNADNCTITTDGDTATTATITDIPSGTVKVRRSGESNPPKAIISGVTPETWIKDALDDHRDNTTVHITAAERSTWNNKSNFSGSYNDLTDKPIPDSALNVASTNPVQNQALYSELRIDNESGETETTLVFDGVRTTNYPQGCTKIKVEDITSNSSNNINFLADDGSILGYISVENWGSISVDTSNFQGASYEISGSTVIISYPTVTTVTKFDVANSTKYTYKAITSSTTPLKNQVVANTTALGGLSLVKLTESEYAALVSKDANTLYVVIPDPS